MEIEVDFKISIKKEHMKAEKKELFDLGNLNCSKAETNMSIGTAEEIYDED